MAATSNNQILIPNMNEPSKPLTMITIPNPITLTSTNYLSWKTQIEAILIGYDLFNHLNSNFPAPPATVTDDDHTSPNPAYHIWHRQDKLIFGALIGTLSSDIVPLIYDAKTTSQMWDILAKIYAKPQVTNSLSSTCNHKKRRHNKDTDNEGDQSKNVDFISRLPNDILVYLLSFVEIKTAARTSLLSKRWRNVWTYLTHLNFDISENLKDLILEHRNPDTSELQKYLKCVNQAIIANRATNLNTFRIHCPVYGLYAANIHKWIQFALSKNVCNLELNLSISTGRPILQPTPLFHNFVYKRYYCNSNLKFLHLEAVDIIGSLIESSLSNCVNLEHLVVRRCEFFVFRKHLKVHDKKQLVVLSLKLIHLELTWCSNIVSLEISAPKLTSFVFAPESKVKVEYTSVPSLVNATFAGMYASDIFSDFSHQLEKLSLSWSQDSPAPTGFPAFPNVKQLEFTVSDAAKRDENILGLISLIEACPLLHTFKLKLQPWAHKMSSLSAVKNDKISAVSAHQHLKTVEFVGFTGSASSVELALCLAEHAPLVNKFIFNPYNTEEMGEPCKWYGKEGMDRIRDSKTEAELLANGIRGLGVDVVMIP